MRRISVFVDGFNLYHALGSMKDQRFKWLDLKAVAKRLCRPHTEQVVQIHYFSAYAEWAPAKKERHQQYVAALEASGVNVMMGHFKHKDTKCDACGSIWKRPEEKETDVNVALQMLDRAYRDEYDDAMLISRDSDLKPAVELVLKRFTDKRVIVVAPPMRGHSSDLMKVASECRKITPGMVRTSLLPEFVADSNGQVVAVRPIEYR